MVRRFALVDQRFRQVYHEYHQIPSVYICARRTPPIGHPASKSSYPHARISSLYLVVQVVQGVYKARLTRANACTTCKSPRGTPSHYTSQNPCLTWGNSCTTSSGTPPDTPCGYSVRVLKHQPLPLLGIPGRPAGRTPRAPTRRPGGLRRPRVGDRAREDSGSVGHSPPEPLFLISDPCSRRVRRWRPPGLARDPSETCPCISRELYR